jgi:homoserine O-acetyltransferase/O-succinyltransferase
MSRPEKIGDTFISPPPRDLVLPEGFRFRHGQVIAPFTLGYETFGELNADRSNAILVCHALSASPHVAGKYSHSDRKPGWWDGLVGYGKGIDLERYFVICVNLPGSCAGTTAPSWVDPGTGKPHGSRFPWPTIEDMVESQRIVLDHFGIEKVLTVAGGSLGGMQALMWAVLYPERISSVLCMAAAAAVPVQGVAWHTIGRKLIESDPHFNGGDYYDHPGPLRGLQLARMIGHMTYLSNEALEKKFGRRRRHPTPQFEIDSYLEYQGQKFAAMFDANCYIRIQAAMDEMDLGEQYGSLDRAFRDFRSRALLISFDTDWLFPTPEVVKVYNAMRMAGADVEHREISTVNGHDAFLIDYHLITSPVREFLESVEPGQQTARRERAGGA